MGERDQHHDGLEPGAPDEASSSPPGVGHEACLEAAARLEEGLLLARADLANERRRRQSTVQKTVRRERGRILLDVLGVVDNLERALSQDGASTEALLEGVAAVLQQSRQLLTEHGVSRLKTEGSAFDPELHEAVGIAEAGAAGIVATELVSGYRLDDEVLRVAKVLVGRGAGS